VTADTIHCSRPILHDAYHPVCRICSPEDVSTALVYPQAVGSVFLNLTNVDSSARRALFLGSDARRELGFYASYRATLRVPACMLLACSDVNFNPTLF
jgi:hypothetical protein